MACTFANTDGSAPSWAKVNSDRAADVVTAVTNTMNATATVALTTS